MTDRVARTIAWWMWSLGQAGLLALYAGGIPLSGGYPTPVAATAPLGLSIGQLVFGTLLAPLLFADRGTILSAVGVGLLCQAIAGRLAGTSVVESLPLVATVAVWLAVAGLSSWWPTARLAMLFAVLAGPMLFYARLEYAGASTSPHFWTWAWSPTVGIGSTALHRTPWPTLIVGLILWSGCLIGRSVGSCLPKHTVSADFEP